MQQIPDRRGGAELLSFDAVQHVMACNHNHPDRGDRPTRHVNECREYDHRSADGENDLEDEMVKVKIKRPGDADDGHFDKHQPTAAREKVTADLAGLSAHAIEKRGHARQQYESWCAEMRDPVGQKQCRVSDVARIEIICCEKVARVIKRHHSPRRRSIETSRVRPATCAGFILSESAPVDGKCDARKGSNANFMKGWLFNYNPNVNPRHRGRTSRAEAGRNADRVIRTSRSACSESLYLSRAAVTRLIASLNFPG